MKQLRNRYEGLPDGVEVSMVSGEEIECTPTQYQGGVLIERPSRYHEGHPIWGAYADLIEGKLAAAEQRIAELEARLGK